MFFQVLPRTECLVSGPANHNRADLGIASRLLQGVVEFLFHFLVERVIDLGTVQRDGADSIGYVVQQRLVGWHKKRKLNYELSTGSRTRFERRMRLPSIGTYDQLISSSTSRLL